MDRVDFEYKTLTAMLSTNVTIEINAQTPPVGEDKLNKKRGFKGEPSESDTTTKAQKWCI